MASAYAPLALSGMMVNYVCQVRSPSDAGVLLGCRGSYYDAQQHRLVWFFKLIGTLIVTFACLGRQKHEQVARVRRLHPGVGVCSMQQCRSLLSLSTARCTRCAPQVRYTQRQKLSRSSSVVCYTLACCSVALSCCNQILAGHVS